jgi:hypothetical protein
MKKYRIIKLSCPVNISRDPYSWEDGRYRIQKKIGPLWMSRPYGGYTETFESAVRAIAQKLGEAERLPIPRDAVVAVFEEGDFSPFGETK